MKRRYSYYCNWLIAILLLFFLVGCKHSSHEASAPLRAIYHWKTTWNPSRWEQQFLTVHHIERIYLRLFDVDINKEMNWSSESIVPIATTQIEQPLPQQIEVVPSIYITNEAMRQYTPDVATKIVERVKAMMEYHKTEWHELQIDCDWTAQTRTNYYACCKDLQTLLSSQGRRLSSTLRLHQVGGAIDSLDVSRFTLMLYNTGNLMQPATNNSILDYRQDVIPYLDRIPTRRFDSLDLAVPLYGWGVVYRNNQFSCLIHQTDFSDTSRYHSLGDHRYSVVAPHTLEGNALQVDDHIRVEQALMEDLLPMLQRLHSDTPRSLVIYHLDSASLSHYSFEQVEQLFQ